MEPNWLEAKVNVAVVLVVPSAGPVSTVVSGGVVSAGASTVQVNSAGCSSTQALRVGGLDGERVLAAAADVEGRAATSQAAIGLPFSEHS